MQQAALSHGIIQGPNFLLRLSPWTKEYRCHKIPYNTLVIVGIKDIPCYIQGYNFNGNTGICTATGYAHSPITIPTNRTLGLSYSHGEELHSFHLSSTQAFKMNQKSKPSHNLQRIHLKEQTSPMHQTMIRNSFRIQMWLEKLLKNKSDWRRKWKRCGTCETCQQTQALLTVATALTVPLILMTMQTEFMPPDEPLP
ncbi:unnamed protein product [Urochloa humidicola]